MRNRFAIAMTLLLGFAGLSADARGMGLPAASFAAGGTGLTSFYVIGFELGPWQEYLAQELTPDYLLDGDAVSIRADWLKSSEALMTPGFAADLVGRPADTRMFMNFEWQSAGDFLWPAFDDESIYQGSSFERQMFAPGFEHQFSDSGVLGVSAVIAYQRYSAANLGLRAATDPSDPFWDHRSANPYQESSYGTGVRLAMRQELFKGFALDAGFQSRIDMEEFAAYRGVYAQPADLDIPARASVGLAFQASQRSWLNVAIERVMYSDISAFPSRYLPNRFLSLLGDSTSPAFDWQDLTIYSVGWAWSDGDKQQWSVNVSTRTQPSPTSALLNSVLRDDLADSAMVVGYMRRTGKRSQLNFNAAYAPSEYAFGGSVLGITTEQLDQRFELEAMWTLNF